MELHQNAKEQMLRDLHDDLGHLVIKNGQFIDRVSAFLSFYRANKVLPTQGKLKRSLEQWIGDFPFVEFCSDFLADELLLYGTYIAGDNSKLITELPGYEDVDDLSKRLLTAFESLPWSYALTLELGTNILPPLPEDATSYALGGNTHLNASNLFLAQEFPSGSSDEVIQKRFAAGGGINALLIQQPFEWKPDAAYFQAQVEGFVGPFGGGTPLDTATTGLKSFLGLGLGMRLFTHEDKYDRTPRRREWIVHRRAADQWELRQKLRLDDEDSRVLSELGLWNRFGANYPEDQKLPWLKSVLARVSAALRSDHSSTLRLASQWFWDSHKGNDEVLRYVRRMTTLEILLGEGADTSEASLGELLGNRLAYLIGKTHKERTETLAEFKKIYNIRSRILHRGKHRLVGEERYMMARLQKLCEKALDEEAKIVATPEKSAR
jgi:hypothetical protein